MLHASSWLGYSWDLADLVYHGGDGIRKDGGIGGRVEMDRVSRREKFRSSAGPCRKELQWLEILAILRKVSKLPGVHSAEGITSDNGGSSLQVQPKLSASSEHLGSHCSQTSVSGGDVLLVGCFEPKLEHMLQEVMWPFNAVGDMTSMYFIEIPWENLPSSADPVVGGGYRTECTREKGRLKSKGSNLNNSYEDSNLNDIIENEAHFEHGDSLGRGERKRWQVEKIASALKSFQLKPGATVVDFGCGSGALTLPLGAIFPEYKFVGVDFKLQSIILLEERARRGHLQNVRGVYGRIENYSGSFDACVALHACGIATDLALLQAMKNRAAYVMSPCCIGKLQIPIEWSLNSTDSGVSFKRNSKFIADSENLEFTSSQRQQTHHGVLATHSCILSSSASVEKDERSSPEVFDPRGETRRNCTYKTCTGSECENHNVHRLGGWASVSCKLVYPRSRWLRNCISENEFQVLARAADWSSYDYESFSSRLHSLCKVVLELDRNEASREVGYWTGLYTLSNKKAGTIGVSHVLVGKPH